MNGVAAVVQLLGADATLIALVPVTRIAAGVLTQDTTLPAITVASISTVDRNINSPGATRFVSERVEVKGYASSYPAQKVLLAAIKAAVADKTPTVSGISNVTVHTDGAGPDFMNEMANIYIGSLDFRVKYTETR